MAKVTFIDAAGKSTQLEGDDGKSVMQLAVGAGLGGIVGECGGSAMCATCHVYVDESWTDRLPVPLSTELEMLECAADERRPNSRLSCQLKLRPELDGLTVRMPDRQQ